VLLATTASEALASSLPAAITGATAIIVFAIGHSAEARSERRRWRREQLIALYRDVVTASRGVAEAAPWRAQEQTSPGRSERLLAPLDELDDPEKQQVWHAAVDNFMELRDEVALLGSYEMEYSMGYCVGSMVGAEMSLKKLRKNGPAPEKELSELGHRIEKTLEQNHRKIVQIARQEIALSLPLSKRRTIPLRLTRRRSRPQRRP
jgi:hypothetical protein